MSADREFDVVIVAERNGSVSGYTVNFGIGEGSSATSGQSDTLAFAFSKNSTVGKIANPILDLLNEANPIWEAGF